MLRYQGVTLVYLFCCVSPAASEVEAKAQQQTDIQLCVCLRAHSGGSPSLSPLLSWCCDLTTRLSLSLSASGLLTFRLNFTCLCCVEHHSSARGFGELPSARWTEPGLLSGVRIRQTEDVCFVF